MKKILSSRMGQVLISSVVVIACLAGLTHWAKNMILNDENIQAYIEAKKAQIDDENNGTDADPPPVDDLARASVTPQKKEYEEQKPEQNEVIINAFEILNNNTSPGDLQFTNPKLPVLMSELNNKWSYINKREAELNELEAHLAEQLQSMHWHTNQITRNRNQLSQHFNGRINLIRKEEESRLQEMAKIYESLLAPDQPEGPAVVRQILRANLAQDVKLNAKIFRYISVTNQAVIIRTLLSGEDTDTELYQNIIQNHRKTMAVDAIKPEETETP